MTYINDRPGALFASGQDGLRRILSLDRRLAVRHLEKAARSPATWIRRRLAYLGARGSLEAHADAEFQASGFADVAADCKPEIERLIGSWQPKCLEKLADESENRRSPFTRNEILHDPAVRSVVLHPTVLRRIAHYLGETPIFSGADIWVGRRNALYAGSPFFHVDSAGWGNARLYVYLSDVAVGHGEFTYIPRPGTLAFMRATGYLGDGLSDRQVVDFFGDLEGVSRSVTGPAGTAFLIDTTRCLHFGSRCTEGHRFALIAAYRRWSSPNDEDTGAATFLKRHNLVPDDPIVAQALAV